MHLSLNKLKIEVISVIKIYLSVINIVSLLFIQILELMNCAFFSSKACSEYFFKGGIISFLS